MEFEGFWLNSNQYVEIAPNDQGWRWSQELDLYLGIHNNQLRYFDTSGQFIPTPDEAADLAQQQVELEAQRAKQEAQRAERLAQKLRELGVDPEQV